MGVDKIGGENLPISNIQNNIDNVKSDEFEKKLKAAFDAKDDKKLREVAQDMESIFTQMMFKEMRKTISQSDLVESAPGKDIFESMFDEEVAKQSAKGKGFGLADMIYKQLSQQMKNKNKIDE